MDRLLQLVRDCVAIPPSDGRVRQEDVLEWAALLVMDASEEDPDWWHAFVAAYPRHRDAVEGVAAEMMCYAQLEQPYGYLRKGDAMCPCRTDWLDANGADNDCSWSSTFCTCLQSDLAPRMKELMCDVFAFTTATKRAPLHTSVRDLLRLRSAWVAATAPDWRAPTTPMQLAESARLNRWLDPHGLPVLRLRKAVDALTGAALRNGDVVVLVNRQRRAPLLKSSAFRWFFDDHRKTHQECLARWAAAAYGPVLRRMPPPVRSVRAYRLVH